MSKSQLEYIRHMLDEAEYLLQASQGISYQTFSGNPTLTRAFARSLEVIGRVVIYSVFKVIGACPRIPASLHYPVHCVHFYAPVNEPGRLIYYTEVPAFFQRSGCCNLLLINKLQRFICYFQVPLTGHNFVASMGVEP